MFSWRDTRWYWLIRYSDLKSVSKPPWYLRSSHHLRSQSQLKLVLLEEEQVEADFQSRPGQPGLYHQPQLRSRLEQIWFKSGWSLAILQHSYLLPALCIQKQLRSFSHFSTIRAQKLSHKHEGLVMRRRIFNIYFGQRQRYGWSWYAAIAAPVIDWFISTGWFAAETFAGRRKWKQASTVLQNTLHVNF